MEPDFQEEFLAAMDIPARGFDKSVNSGIIEFNE